MGHGSPKQQLQFVIGRIEPRPRLTVELGNKVEKQIIRVGQDIPYGDID